MNEKTITESELENIHIDLDRNFQSPTMNSDLMTDHHNEPDNFIDYSEDFSSIAADSYVNTRSKKYKQVPPRLADHNWL